MFRRDVLASVVSTTSKVRMRNAQRLVRRAAVESLETRQLFSTFNVAAGDTAGLIAAINSANTNPGADTVSLAGGTYILSALNNYWYGPNGLPAITSSITVDGNGATIQRSTAGGTPAFRLFYVAGTGGTGASSGLSAGTLTLKNLTLNNGLAKGGNGGNDAGGGAGLGGAIFNQGSTSLSGVTVTGSTAQGGNGGAAATNTGGGGGGGLGGNGGVIGGINDGGGGGGGFFGQGGTSTFDGGGGGGGIAGAGATGGEGGGGGGGTGGAGGAGGPNNTGLGGGGGGGLVNAGGAAPANSSHNGGNGSDGAAGGTFNSTVGPGDNGDNGNPGGGGGGASGSFSGLPGTKGGNGGNGGLNGGGGGGAFGGLIGGFAGPGGDGGNGGFGGGGGGGGNGGDDNATAIASSRGGNGGFGGGGGGSAFSFYFEDLNDSLGRAGDGGVGGGGGGSASSFMAGRGGDGGFGAGGGAGNPSFGGRGGNGGFGGGGGAGDTIFGPDGGTSAFAGGAGANSAGGAGGGGAGLGGAIFNDGGTLTVSNSTFTQNTAVGGTGANAGQGLGGAIFSRNGTVTVRNATISANTAANGGRGIYVRRDGSTTTLLLYNSIVGQSDNSVSDTASSTAGGAITVDFAGNVIRNDAFFGINSGNPLLGALANNGGLTQTMLPAAGSPAISAGSNSQTGGATTDQRGNARIQAGLVDAGAVELTDPAPLTVTINQAATQADPTSEISILFTATFSEPVTDFDDPTDVVLSGTAGATAATITPVSSTVYTISVSGMPTSGTVIASIPVGAALDASRFSHGVSTSTDNTVTYNRDSTPPNVTINQAFGQADPTLSPPILFTVTFDEPVSDFDDPTDIVLSGTAGATTASILPVSSTIYIVSVGGLTNAGTVIATVPAGAAKDPTGNGNLASTSTDNTVFYDPNTAPTVVAAIPDLLKNEDALIPAINLRDYFTDSEDGSAGLSYAITGNTNAGLFSSASIDNSTDVLSLVLTPDASGVADITITATDSGNLTVTDTFRVDVASVNDAPSFTKGLDQTVLEDAGLQTVTGWATNRSTGPANESGQTLSFLVTGNTNSGLFAVAPAITPDGTLSYTPAADANGSATITVVIQDNGDTANGGIDTSDSQTFVIDVTPVNDAPSFTKGDDQIVLEDAGPQTVSGWATNLSTGPSNESSQTLSFQVTGNTNTGLFIAGPTIAPDGTLTYTPAPDANGSATITLVAKDTGGIDNGGVDTSLSQTFVINVTPVSDISIGDVSKLEGNSGTTLFQFPVTRDSSAGVSAVDFVTLRDSANDIDDYNYATGSVFFADGEIAKTVTVGVKGDTNFEPDQKFNVVLSNPSNAQLGKSVGVGTIVNDDGKVGLSINDVAITEGNSGTKNLVFTITLNAGSHPVTTVKYTTVGGTATSGTDFTAKAGTVTFGTFVTSQTISIPIIGNTAVEPDETFKVVLSNVTGGAVITDDTGVGTILNDDVPPPPPLPKVSIADVTVLEGTGTGVTLLSFTVKLDKAATGTVTVAYGTTNGSATAGSDYTAASGTVTFAAGQLSKTFTVQVKKDAVKEADETLFINLGTLTGPAIYGNTQAKGTIKNDD